MQNKLYLFSISFLFIFLFAACTGDAPSEKEEGDGMAQFTKDENFKDAHEKPAKIAFEGQGEILEFPTPDGKTGKAHTLKTEAESNKYLFVIHEWWGLNDQVKQEAERLFGELEHVNVMALDLYDGKVTDNPDEAGKYMRAVSQERCEAIINGALALVGDDAKVATIGWCFGGGWSLRSSILANDRGAGCVMYYGMPVEKADEIAPLKADILGIFAKQDGWINQKVITPFEGLARATGKNLEVHWFDAEHAFANPSGARYNEAAAQEANGLALAFLREKLK
ncbi:MAG: dienelactone hydrolase family protein [Bacteroidota bacterium]